MLTLNDLSEQIDSCQRGELSLEDFESWFEDVSTGEVYDNPSLRGAFVAVDSALGEYHFDHIGEPALRQRLESAIRTFEQKRPQPEQRAKYG